MTPNEFADVRRLLDAAPEPTVSPIDVAAIYRAAATEQARAARRWKRATAAVAALAAGVCVAVVAWGRTGSGEGPNHTPDPELLARLDRIEGRLRDADAVAAKLKATEDLLLTLAADVDDRDRRQSDALAAVVQDLRAFRLDAGRRFQDGDRTSAALYTAVFDKPKSEGVNP